MHFKNRLTLPNKVGHLLVKLGSKNNAGGDGKSARLCWYHIFSEESHH